jgi:regulator of protease activity HflC (stomatin/prohibitin superfamily)
MFLIIVGFVIGLIIAATIAFVSDFKQMGAAIAAGLATVLLFVVGSSFTVISAGHTGVQVTFGEVNPQPLTEGVHMVNPISSIADVDVRLQKVKLDGANAGTKDLQVLHTDIVVNYRLDPLKVPHIFKEYGLNVDEKVLGPGINEAFKSVTGHYTSEELVTKRDLVSQEILQHLVTKMAPFNITVSNISLVNFGFSQAYQQAIEDKVISAQKTAKAQQDLERIKVEAASRIAQAEGEAKAIAIQASAIQSNGGANYVQLQWIEKWDGKLPATVVGADSKTLMNISK